nr:NADH dehydrogenase [ubiquinone] iron-sulfur protein 2 [Tanacetum cinerariifolium]
MRLIPSSLIWEKGNRLPVGKLDIKRTRDSIRGGASGFQCIASKIITSLSMDHCRPILELIHVRANEHRLQQQETMTNRVRHLATSARKRNVVLVEAFFSLLVKGAMDVRRVRASRTTERPCSTPVNSCGSNMPRGQRGIRSQSYGPTPFEVTVPISTNRCFQIWFSVDIPSNSSIREANCCVEESISRHKLRGRSCATPPGRMKLACILPPETISYNSNNFSRSLKAYRNEVDAPTSIA